MLIKSASLYDTAVQKAKNIVSSPVVRGADRILGISRGYNVGKALLKPVYKVTAPIGQLAAKAFVGGAHGLGSLAAKYPVPVLGAAGVGTFAGYNIYKKLQQIGQRFDTVPHRYF